jgi:hypothetical protein
VKELALTCQNAGDQCSLTRHTLGGRGQFLPVLICS